MPSQVSVPETNEVVRRKTVPSLLPPENGSDGKAVKEAQALADNDYEEQAKRNEYRRSEVFKDTIEKIAIYFIWLGAAIVLLALLSIAFHLLAPISCHYLSKDQLATIQSILASGLVSGVATKYLDKRQKP